MQSFGGGKMRKVIEEGNVVDIYWKDNSYLENVKITHTPAAPGDLMEIEGEVDGRMARWAINTQIIYRIILKEEAV